MSRRITFMILGMIAGNVALYVLGTVWFMIVTGMTLEASLAACVIPFIPGNFIKMAAVVVVAPPVENAIRRTAQTNEPAV
jgi:biotin transport system substrate-specific component